MGSLRKLRVRPPHTLASFWEDHELCVPYLFPFSGAFSGLALNNIERGWHWEDHSFDD